MGDDEKYTGIEVENDISIHVPRAGDDSKTVQFFRSLQHVLHYFLLIGSSNPILF